VKIVEQVRSTLERHDSEKRHRLRREGREPFHGRQCTVHLGIESSNPKKKRKGKALKTELAEIVGQSKGSYAAKRRGKEKRTANWEVGRECAPGDDRKDASARSAERLQHSNE